MVNIPFCSKFLGNASTYAPEVREGLMRPKLTPELHLIQLRNADAFLSAGMCFATMSIATLQRKDSCRFLRLL